MINFILFFLSYFSKTNSTDCTFIGIYSTRRNCIFCKIISIIETTVCQEKLQHLQKLKLLIYRSKNCMCFLVVRKNRKLPPSY